MSNESAALDLATAYSAVSEMYRAPTWIFTRCAASNG